jgi:hypothetical protein
VRRECKSHIPRVVWQRTVDATPQRVLTRSGCRCQFPSLPSLCWLNAGVCSGERSASRDAGCISCPCSVCRRSVLPALGCAAGPPMPAFQLRRLGSSRRTPWSEHWLLICVCGVGLPRDAAGGSTARTESHTHQDQCACDWRASVRSPLEAGPLCGSRSLRTRRSLGFTLVLMGLFRALASLRL